MGFPFDIEGCCSLSNILIVAVLFATIYAIYRMRKTKERKPISYQTVESKKAQELKSEGKIKAVVTGGSGTLGKQIVRCLIEDGNYLIYSLDLYIPAEKDRNDDVYSYIQADIFDMDSLRSALKDAEVVFHNAGLVPSFIGFTYQNFFDVNVTGTKNVVAASKEVGVKRLIYTSSIATMISSDPSQVVEMLDESTPYPEQNRDDYGTTKAMGERCVLGANGDGFVTCSLRPHHIYDAKRVMGESQYYGDGSKKMQFITMRTTAQIHILAEKKLKAEGESCKLAGKVYILTREDTFTHKEKSELIAEELGVKATSTPLWIMTVTAYANVIFYKITGKILVDRGLRPDILFFYTQTQTFTGALGRKEIGWEDPRSSKEVIRELIQEGKESKKNN